MSCSETKATSCVWAHPMYRVEQQRWRCLTTNVLIVNNTNVFLCEQQQSLACGHQQHLVLEHKQCLARSCLDFEPQQCLALNHNHVSFSNGINVLFMSNNNVLLFKKWMTTMSCVRTKQCPALKLLSINSVSFLNSNNVWFRAAAMSCGRTKMSLPLNSNNVLLLIASNVWF